jgi:hypothetical protein
LILPFAGENDNVAFIGLRPRRAPLQAARVKLDHAEIGADVVCAKSTSANNPATPTLRNVK